MITFLIYYFQGISHGFLYNWIGKLFLPSAWLGHSLIFYNFKTIHLKLIKFDENMVLWLVNQNFEKNQVLMYHFSSNACLRKLNLNLREKKSWFSNACNFLRKPFSNLLKHDDDDDDMRFIFLIYKNNS